MVINLSTPWRIRRINHLRKYWTHAILYAVALPIFFSSILWCGVTYRTHALLEKNSILRASMREHFSTRNYVSKNLRAAEHFHNLIGYLDQLSSVTQIDVMITTLTCEAKKLRLTGVAKTPDALTHFIRTLNIQNRFTKIILKKQFSKGSQMHFVVDIQP